MNSVDFCFWLQGFFEISDATSLTDNQVQTIKNHLNLVFKHEIDPMREEQTTTSVEILNETHQGKPSLADALSNIAPNLKVPTNMKTVFQHQTHNGYNNGHDNDELVRC